jgi:hypothetical protein
MPTNLTINPVDSTAICYFQDGSSFSVPSGEQQSVQVITDGICSVSDKPPSDEAEHMSQEERALEFAEAMVAFWQGLVTKARAEMRKPTATPV